MFLNHCPSLCNSLLEGKKADIQSISLVNVKCILSTVQNFEHWLCSSSILFLSALSKSVSTEAETSFNTRKKLSQIGV